MGVSVGSSCTDVTGRHSSSARREERRMGVVRCLQQRCKDLFGSSLHPFLMSKYQTRDVPVC